MPGSRQLPTLPRGVAGLRGHQYHLNSKHKENDMTITPTTLFRASGVATSVAGLIFVGVQINHPHLDATSITTTDVMVRNFLKMLMAALAIAGITGMYLRQVTKIGVLGLLGYVLFAVGLLSIFGTEFIAALVLPSIAHSATAYVNDVIAAANNGTANGDIGLMQSAILYTGIAYLAGGFIFGVALFRANVLARWAAALLALGTLATIATGLVPQYERLFAIPTALALVALGYSLWRDQRAPAAPPVLNPVSSPLDAVGAK